MKSQKFFIAQVGRTVGLHGDMKLNLHTDFPEQFKSGAVLATDKGDLQIDSYDPRRGLVRFVGYASVDSAKPLTNTKLYSTLEQTRDHIQLGEGEYFWFDIIGSTVIENGEILGIVEDIDRMLDTDYLAIVTDPALVDQGLPKDFLLPYIPRYIVKFDSTDRQIHTIDARSVLEAS
jgi:16S rRNA processing protein RimM